MDAANSSARAVALGTLARADKETIERAWRAWENVPQVETIRGPEVGLVMVRGRIGGGGAPFNVGEATVARASVRIETGEIGHGYCLGRDTEKALRIATIDALFQREPENVEFAILRPLRAKAHSAVQRKAEETAATRVDFFTMVRGEDE